MINAKPVVAGVAVGQQIDVAPKLVPVRDHRAALGRVDHSGDPPVAKPERAVVNLGQCCLGSENLETDQR